MILLHLQNKKLSKYYHKILMYQNEIENAKRSNRECPFCHKPVYEKIKNVMVAVDIKMAVSLLFGNKFCARI